MASAELNTNVRLYFPPPCNTTVAKILFRLPVEATEASFAVRSLGEFNENLVASSKR